MSTSHPAARNAFKSRNVALEPGSSTRSALAGSGSLKGWIETEMPGSSRSGSRSSKFAIRGSAGTTTRSPSPLVERATRSTESSAGNRSACPNHGTTPSEGQPVRSAMIRSPDAKSAGSPRNRLVTMPRTSARSPTGSSACVPTTLAMTPPRSMSATRRTGTSAASAKPMLAMSPARRFTSEAEPAPSTITRSASPSIRAKLVSTAGISPAFIAA